MTTGLIYTPLKTFTTMFTRLLVFLLCLTIITTSSTQAVNRAEALELALSTWPQDITPVVHYSESKHTSRQEKPTPAHSDIVYGPINTYGNTMDIMVEAKHKEFAIYALNNNVL